MAFPPPGDPHLLTLLFAALAQSPSVAPWRVLETEHYQVHYPAPAEEWTLHQVERLEAIRERVSAEVGWTPDFKVQVIVQDPFSEANGAALPLGRSPRMVLWTFPPGADSVIGTYRDWGELLITHEDAHIVHLMKPPRGLSGQLMYSLFRLAPVTVKSPRWVIEGYATVVEGRLTGSGRPHGAYRGTLLRRLAQQGALPSYGELNGSDRWQGFGYAYLVGSAYLEWLEARPGDGTLRDVWARMTARKVRSFDQAFEGVFGDKPWILYQRFCAELTADAMAADGADWDRSTLWMDTSWSTGIPALSPDGDKLAVVVGSKDGPPTLRVWKTEPNQKAIDRRQERIDTLTERDPDDVVAIDPRTAPHELVASLVDRSHSPRTARWIDDSSLLFDAGDFDRYRRLRRDLYRFDVDTSSTTRLTRHADLRDADPHPDGQTAVAIRGSWGLTQLVLVDLETAQITALTEPSAEVVVDQPRYSDDGSTLLYLRHDGSSFRPVLRDLDSGDESPLPLPAGAATIHATWRGESIIASLAVQGRIDLWRLAPDTEPERLTHSGAAFGPEPSEQGLYYLQMQADGLEVHYLADGPVLPPPGDSLGLVGPVADLDAPPLPSTPQTSHPIGLGRLEPRLLTGGMVGQRASNVELGLRLGDVVGRNDFVAVGSLGDRGGVTGGALWWANRTLPADLELRAWGVQDGLTPPWWTGGSIALESEGGSSTRWGVARGGAWIETATDGTTRGEAFVIATGSLVAPRTRWLRVWTLGKASAGQGSGLNTTLTEAASGFALGRAWTLSSDYRIGRSSGADYSLGGVASGLRAEEAQWRQLQNGWSAPNTATGTVHDRMEVAIGSNGIDAFGERRRVWTGQGVVPYSLLGLRFRQSAEAQSLVKVPGVEIEIGIGCALERGRVVERACRKLEDYRSWSGIIWRP